LGGQQLTISKGFSACSLFSANFHMIRFDVILALP